MSWSEQSESIMKAWTESQKKMWEGWYDVLQNMAAPMMSFPNMMSQWQQMASQGLGTMMSDTDQTSRNVSRQLVTAQATMMRFLELTTKAWNTMMPKLEAGQDWQAILTDYMEQFRKQMMVPANMMGASQNATELWQMYMQSMQTVLQPWMKAWQQTPGHFGVAMAGNGGAELIDMTSMYWKAYEQTMGQMVGVPSVGFTRELEEKFAKGFTAWTKFRKAMDDYQMLVADAWAGVYEEVLREMMKRAEQGKPIESVRDLVKLWTGAADKSFSTIFVTEKYSQIQADFMTTFMEYRIEEQKIVDEVMKYGYIPTRTEMDEAHRNIYELRKEVKALKKALKTKQSSEAPAS